MTMLLEWVVLTMMLKKIYRYILISLLNIQDNIHYPLTEYVHCDTQNLNLILNDSTNALIKIKTI